MAGENPSVRANAIICLIHQTNFLLDQQIAALEEQFVSEGGYSELLAAERLKERQKQKFTNPVPACPKCNSQWCCERRKPAKKPDISSGVAPPIPIARERLMYSGKLVYGSSCIE